MQKIDRQAKCQEIEKNYQFFKQILPELETEHIDEFVLIRKQKIIGFYPSLIEAQLAGLGKYTDQLFSIQEVRNKPVELGFFRYAVGNR